MKDTREGPSEVVEESGSAASADRTTSDMEVVVAPNPQVEVNFILLLATMLAFFFIGSFFTQDQPTTHLSASTSASVEASQAQKQSSKSKRKVSAICFVNVMLQPSSMSCRIN